MSDHPARADVRAGRLADHAYARNFADLHPPLGPAQARVQAERCYFCFDAPCVEACPTGIDIPLFIREIATGNAHGAAHLILNENIFGGMCARVCPTETLCEQACVRHCAGESPVSIGQLQRYATDALFAEGEQIFSRGADTGKTVAVVGAGPAGLACAHALSRAGHRVTVFDARDKPGGLNEYGIAAYKTVDDFAQTEIAYITAIGGIEIQYGKRLGRDLSLARLREQFDAVFLGIGLGATNGLGEDLHAGVEDAVDYIARLRQAEALERLPVGSRVLVIGGGMTAVDIAVQIAKLGAREVTMVYRRGRGHMKASSYEQALAQEHGVSIMNWRTPMEIRVDPAGGYRVTVARTATDGDGNLVVTDETTELAADQVFKAIGQKLADAASIDGIELQDGRIVTDDERATSVAGIWAGGDCIAGGDNLTVSAVQDGKVAAAAIDRFLSE